MAFIADVGVRHMAQRKLQRTPGTAEPKATDRSREGLWFALLVCAMVWLWQPATLDWITAEQGLGYAMGIVAVACMLTLLIYPVRKRLRFLAFIGPTRRWFQIHMWLGVLGPSAALVHSNFQLGSLNSQIALYSALLVAGSGLVGRVLYRKIHQNLYGRKTDLGRLQAELLAQQQGASSLRFMTLIHSRLRSFDKKVIGAGRHLRSAVWLALLVRFRVRREHRALHVFAERQLARQSLRNPVMRRHRQQLLQNIDHYLESHMNHVREVARIQAYERLFALWHVAHLPFFVLLVLSVIVHVAAVHLY